MQKWTKYDFSWTLIMPLKRNISCLWMTFIWFIIYSYILYRFNTRVWTRANMAVFIQSSCLICKIMESLYFFWAEFLCFENPTKGTNFSAFKKLFVNLKLGLNFSPKASSYSRFPVSSCRLRVLRGERQGEHQRAAGVRASGGHHLREDVGARGRGGAGGSQHQDHQTDRQARPATSEVLLIDRHRSAVVSSAPAKALEKKKTQKKQQKKNQNPDVTFLNSLSLLQSMFVSSQ